MSRHITTTIQDGIGHVRLARPDKLNALTLDMLDDLEASDKVERLVRHGVEPAGAVLAALGSCLRRSTSGVSQRYRFSEVRHAPFANTRRGEGDDRE